MFFVEVHKYIILVQSGGFQQAVEVFFAAVAFVRELVHFTVVEILEIDADRWITDRHEVEHDSIECFACFCCAEKILAVEITEHFYDAFGRQHVELHLDELERTSLADA